jgi:tetratricopeptide (TPR) repeat protein
MHSIDPQGANYQESIDVILGKLNTNPRDMDLHARLARLYQEIGCYEDALVQYYKILRISPNNKNTWLEIAELYVKMKRPDRTKQILKKVASQEGNDNMIMDGVERFKSLTGSN